MVINTVLIEVINTDARLVIHYRKIKQQNKSEMLSTFIILESVTVSTTKSDKVYTKEHLMSEQNNY